MAQSLLKTARRSLYSEGIAGDGAVMGFSKMVVVQVGVMQCQRQWVDQETILHDS